MANSTALAPDSHRPAALCKGGWGNTGTLSDAGNGCTAAVGPFPIPITGLRHITILLAPLGLLLEDGQIHRQPTLAHDLVELGHRTRGASASIRSRLGPVTPINPRTAAPMRSSAATRGTVMALTRTMVMARLCMQRGWSASHGHAASRTRPV